MWIDEKFDIKWMYLVCFILVDTEFLLCGAEMHIPDIRFILLDQVRSPVVGRFHTPDH